MNKDYVLYHLREALEEIETIIGEIESDTDYSQPEFSVAMSHIYHHINTAWNSRSSSEEEAEEVSENNFREWRQFPTDISMES
jgi:predicted transcriptional regulator